MKKNAALCALLTLVVSPVIADETDYRVKQASDLILKLCIASGVQSVEINKKVNSIEVAGDGSSLQIDRRESSGLVGGLSKEITALSAQQASEARSCTQGYLKDLVNLILNDQPGNQARSSGQVTASSENLVEKDPETFWGGRGIWGDNQKYCENLLKFLSASTSPDNFRYLDNAGKVSLQTISTTIQLIEGNYMIRTELGSTARFCAVKYNDGYYALYCARVVSFGRPDVFASVYNQTLKDMWDCLLPAGWEQSSLDQGACIPTGTRGECVRRFTKGTQDTWLYSYFVERSKYGIGIQTKLGK